MKRIYFFFSFLLLFGQIKAQVKINEIMASNASVIADNTGDYTDWIELYNPGASPIDLASYYITDNLTNLTKFRFTTTAGQVVVPANGYVLIWASGVTTRGALHTSFSLSSDGEDIALVSPDGLTIIDSFSFTKQKADVSYGRLPDGGSTFKFFKPSSPNTTNIAANSYIGILPNPIFSARGGFYSDSLLLSITSSDPSATIYYTTDGSEPNANDLTQKTYKYKNTYPGSFLYNTFKTSIYTSALTLKDKTSQSNKISMIRTTNMDQAVDYFPSVNIYKSNVVRAIATKTGYIPSEIATNSYFFTPDARNKYDLPVFSIVLPDSSLFDYNKGIYVAGYDFENITNGANYKREGDISERAAHLELIEQDTVIHKQNLGMRIFGGASRALRLKSLRFSARGIYGESEYKFPLFPQLPYQSYQTFLLRNTGADLDGTYLKDVIAQEAVAHLNFDIQAYRPSVVFINGEYWGLHDIRQRQDKYFYEQKYGVDHNNLDIIGTDIEEGDTVQYNQMTLFVKNNDMATSTNYDYVKTKMDVESFADYQIAEIFFLNDDWGNNNLKFWRERVPFNASAPKGRDGRFRWSFYDLDISMNPSFTYYNKLNYAMNINQHYDGHFLLGKLCQNNDFKVLFINRFADLLNTSFQASHLSPQVISKKNKIANSINEHIIRWNRPTNLTHWNTLINQTIDFINQRPAYQRQHILSQFGISGEYNLTVNVSDTSAGFVRVNTIDIRPSTPGVGSSPYPWTGSYFKNITIKIHARPKPGYKFKHWLFNSTTLTDSVLTLTPAAAIAYTAVFESALFSSNPIPEPYVFNACKYQLLAWNDNAPAASYPDSMRFVYMASTDPLIDASIAGFTTGPYNYTSRTRINGLGNLGFSFINTGSANTGYPAQQLGGALLTISTANIPKIKVSWKGRTIVPNSKEYAIRLQARVGDLITFTDVLDNAGNPIEYQRSATAGDSLSFTAELPAALLNQPFIQLLWRYYYTGNQNNLASGARDQLAVDDIMIETEKELTGSSLVGTTYYKADKIISTVNVLSTSVLDYTAGQSVTLSPGFCTNNGTVFVAKIGCN